jgi:hypothetical protein
MSDLWHLTFSDRSVPKETDIPGISQLPRGKHPTVRVASDSVRVTSNSPLTFDATVAFPLTGQGRPYKEMISELNTRPSRTPVNASTGRLPDKTHHSEPRRLARSYLVRNFHPQLSSGLCWRTLSPFLRPESGPRNSSNQHPDAIGFKIAIQFEATRFLQIQDFKTKCCNRQTGAGGNYTRGNPDPKLWKWLTKKKHEQDSPNQYGW